MSEAFAQAALRELIGVSAPAFARHNEVERWHGRCVLALDGSTLRVPDGEECAPHCGGMATRCGRFRSLARVFALDDVARGGFADSVLGAYADNERSLAREPLPHLGDGDLLGMDRGYPARARPAEPDSRGVAWCVRMGRS